MRRLAIVIRPVKGKQENDRFDHGRVLLRDYYSSPVVRRTLRRVTIA